MEARAEPVGNYLIELEIFSLQELTLLFSLGVGVKIGRYKKTTPWEHRILIL